MYYRFCFDMAIDGERSERKTVSIPGEGGRERGGGGREGGGGRD